MFRNVILVSGLALLAGCGDPLAGLDRLSDVELSEQDTAAQALPTDAEIAREGFLGTEAARPQPSLAQSVAQDETAATAPPKQRRGLLGLLRRAQPDPQADAVAAAVQDADSPQTPTPAVPADEQADKAAEAAPLETAALTPEPQPRKRGLFGRLSGAGTGADKARTGPDAQDVPYGTLLPYGVVARVCAAKGKSLGQKIEKAPARGFALYDSAPGSAGARTYYITGFSDGCPRQLTAANVLLGAPSLYEQLHYGPGGEHLPTAQTDAAYEKIKRQVCGARKGKPCGSKISRMDKTTFFVSAYDSFGNSNRWSELLIHDGEIMAMAVKTNG